MIEYYESNIKQAKDKNPRIRKIAMMTIIVLLLQVVLPTVTMINEDLFNVGVMASTNEQYNIGTAQELWDFATEVNGGNTFSGITVNLTADIALDCDSDNQWIPIGTYIQNTTVECGFNGIFEGNGHSISGIYIDTEEDYQGLFGFNTGIIRNVNVADSYINGIEDVGGIVGYNFGSDEYEGLIYNCNFSGTISAGKIENGTAKGSNKIGGIAGYNVKGTIEKCYNSGSITTVAGGQAAGGIVGINSHGTISECYNIGTISAESGGGLGRYCWRQLGGYI